MVKFAVCDDEREMTDYISNKLREFYPGECEIKSYLDGESLLSDIRRESFDALFLDIVMPGLDGMSLARKIREDNQYVKIIFVTNKAELAYKGYIYNAFRYVRKSELDRELCETAVSLKKLLSSSNELMDFKTATGVTAKYVKSIKYFEVKGHTVTIVCDGGEERVYGTLKDYEERMKNSGFIRIHKSYLVNCRFVNSIENNDVILTCGKKLPLSRKRSDETKKKLLAFRETHSNVEPVFQSSR